MTAAVGTSFCAICQSPIEPGETATVCPDCGAPYHEQCWTENRGCGVYGCPQVPPTEKLEELEIPVSYWGRQHKPCPGCGAEILAAAIRCRHCGAVFPSAAPESPEQYRGRLALAGQGGSVRKGLVWLFVGCMVPFTAPAAAVFGLLWCRVHRREIRALPGFFRALGNLALMVGFAQTLLMALMLALYCVVRG